MTAYTKPEQVQMRQNPSMDMGKWARMSTPSLKTNENLTAAAGGRISFLKKCDLWKVDSASA